MIEVIAIIFGLYLVLKSWVRQKTAYHQAEYLELRYRTFRLREKLVKMTLRGVITEDQCVNLYDSMNWALRYLNDLPFFVIKGFAESARRVGISDDTLAFEEEIKKAPEELKEWYSEFTGILFDAVTLFTPVKLLTRCAKIPIIGSMCMIWFAWWFSYTLVRLRDHPLQRLTLRHTRLPRSVQAVKEVGAMGEEVRSTAERFNNRIAACC
jgi:hypothetical protein